MPAGALIVDRVDILGADKVDEGELEDSIATSKTGHALAGLLQAIPMLTYLDALTVEYRTLDALVLDRDLERVRRWYRARGFHDVHVRAGRIVNTEKGHVRVEIVVEEGEPVLIETATLDFPDWQRAMRVNSRLVDAVTAYRLDPIESPETHPRFDEDHYDETKKKLRRVLTDDGYAYATVTGKVDVDLAKRTAHVRFSASAGPYCHVGKVTFEGLGEIPELPVRRALGINEGDTFSTEKIEQGHYALADFEVFGSVEILPQLSKEGEPYQTRVPIVVRVQPIKLRGVKLGVGAELGSRFDVHGVAGWEDRNLLGGLRKLAINMRPSLLFYPLATDNIFDPPSDVLVVPQAELDIRFTQPGFPDPRSSLIINTAARIYRPRTLFVEGDNVVIYRELEGAVGLERTFRFPYWGGLSFFGSPVVRVQFASPASFNQDEPPPGYDNVLIPLLELNGQLDARKDRDGKLDPANPALGGLLQLQVQGAALGDAEDVRLRPEIRVFAPLGSSVVFALRWTTGFLFPFNYGDTLLQEADEFGADRARQQQLMSFRAFYSGGQSSNRGYTFGGVGPHEELGFKSQAGLSQGLQPLGGRGMWELSGELRFPLVDSLLGVVFVDASDVVRALSGFRVTHPHISPGVGLRIVTPVGRLRFDLGVRPPYLQRLGEAQLTPNEGGPQPGETRIPLAFHVAIGEAI